MDVYGRYNYRSIVNRVYKPTHRGAPPPVPFHDEVTSELAMIFQCFFLISPANKPWETKQRSPFMIAMLVYMFWTNQIHDIFVTDIHVEFGVCGYTQAFLLYITDAGSNNRADEWFVCHISISLEGGAPPVINWS